MESVKFNRGGDRGREDLGWGDCVINMWDGSVLQLALFKKSSSHFENNIPIFLLSGILNTSIFNVHNILQWANFLVMKTFSNIFRSTFYWIYLNIFYISFIFYYCKQVLFTLIVSSYDIIMSCAFQQLRCDIRVQQLWQWKHLFPSDNF